MIKSAALVKLRALRVPTDSGGAVVAIWGTYAKFIAESQEIASALLRGNLTAANSDSTTAGITGGRYEGLAREISYRRGQRYLRTVVDHQTGGIVWTAPGSQRPDVARGFDLLGDRKQSIAAVSIDMSGGYQQAIQNSILQAEVCFDPFHVGPARATRRRPGPP